MLMRHTGSFAISSDKIWVRHRLQIKIGNTCFYVNRRTIRYKRAFVRFFFSLFHELCGNSNSLLSLNVRSYYPIETVYSYNYTKVVYFIQYSRLYDTNSTWKIIISLQVLENVTASVISFNINYTSLHSVNQPRTKSHYSKDKKSRSVASNHVINVIICPKSPEPDMWAIGLSDHSKNWLH